ncbi:Pre-mRNA-splicing ATP-dependent RNA helicase PRP28 [Microdochium trichocladiopsis]|uniref:RNA helicase n=1 Tax=Microdochium trichocladiopsis TaxID=1682393 RepID=A0A9P8YE30_9PEZI|nr:Pre-mRNA-splicing ATP-dependent RNA helicase PRP28 [Microdochium trichocladiopsis]KAH7035261.1 Pre-mRNA-splicing ATP-dependent RNA helicase PRP28 [Microdochium trichocladiopsis]
MAPGAITAGFKPKFIPKAERERLAKQKQEEEEKKKLALQDTKQNDTRNGRSTRDPRDRDVRVPTGPKAMRQDGHDRSRNDGYRDERRGDYRNGNSMNNGNNHTKTNTKRPPPEDRDETLLRERYMGPDLSQSTFSATKKRKRTKKEEFKFDWDNQEDTTGDLALDDEAQNEANIHKRARAIREEEPDPERGEALARQLIEGYYRARDLAEDARRQRERANEVKQKVFSKRWTEKTLEEMQARDWRILREDFDISTKGGNVPHPLRNWRESSLPSKLLSVIDELGYAEPSPIQRATIPIALEARDLIGVAVTGSGKTAAFLLPLLDYISKLPPLTEFTKNDGPYALIIAPTRELAQQIALAAEQFSKPFGFNVVTLIGGHQLEEQVYAMRNGAEIIVATPGRLVDCLERRVLVLSQCHYVIMDEADRMVEMGFEEPLRKVLDALPATDERPDMDIDGAQFHSHNSFGTSRTRRTMMFTATMPPAVERIAKTYLRSPVIVTIGTQGEAVDTVEQRVEFVQGERARQDRILNILHSGEFPAPAIVFVNMKQNCEAVAKEVRRSGFTVVTLHGNKTQEQRETALQALRNGTAKVLVATDLAGRGIDVPDVSLVVNFNMATSIESYTHRIGRTGRAGKKGVAITFLGNEDAPVLYDLKQMISKSPVSKVPDALRQHEAAKQKPTKGRGD